MVTSWLHIEKSVLKIGFGRFDTNQKNDMPERKNLPLEKFLKKNLFLCHAAIGN